MAADDDDRYIRSLIKEVSGLSQQVGAIREQVKEDVAQLLRSYREDIHRTTMGIHARLLSYEDALTLDRVARERRQQQLDGQLSAIERNQRLWIRAVVVIALVTVGVGIGISIWWL